MSECVQKMPVKDTVEQHSAKSKISLDGQKTFTMAKAEYNNISVVCYKLYCPLCAVGSLCLLTSHPCSDMRMHTLLLHALASPHTPLSI